MALLCLRYRRFALATAQRNRLAAFLLTAYCVYVNGVHAQSPRFLVGIPTPITELNTDGAGEAFASFTGDGLDVLYLGRMHESDVFDHDFLLANRDSMTSPFGTPVRVDTLSVPEGFAAVTPGISPDGLTLYYSTVPRVANLTRSDIDKQAIRLFAAHRSSRNAPFEPAVEISTLAIPGAIDPNESADGLSLYTRVLPLGRFDSDLYVSRRGNVNDPWGPAQPVSGLVTRLNWESKPAIAQDELSLFVEHAGIDTTLPNDRLNSVDVKVAVRSATDQGWSGPYDLGDTINLSNKYQTRPFLSGDGSTIYFSRADIDNVNGGWVEDTFDIYQAPVLPFAAESMAGNGASYQQDFNSLSADGRQLFSALPEGWTFTANDVVFNNVTTRGFPTSNRNFAGNYNAGAEGDTDRALTIDVKASEAGELDLRTQVADSPVQALRLEFDIEAWQLRSNLGANPGEAAFHVVLEADSGNGFVQVADLGDYSTGKTLVRPATGTIVDGNDPANRGTFDTGPIDVDVPVGATLRTRWIGTDESRYAVFGLDNVILRFAGAGDANIDGAFDSSDLIQVFQVGEFEDGIAGNSSWLDGDWNNDQEFDSRDLIEAFQLRQYETLAANGAIAVPEPTSDVLLWPVAWLLVGLCRWATIFGARRFS